VTTTRRGFLGLLSAAAGWLATPASVRALAPPPAPPAVLPAAVALEKYYAAKLQYADYVFYSDFLVAPAIPLAASKAIQFYTYPLGEQE
jgi:hypothetical protein